MPKPVLVIHGVANRNKQEFLDEVTFLQSQLTAPGDNYKLIPVWWGDIAEQSFNVDDVLPLTDQTRGTGQAADVAFGMSLLNAPARTSPAAAPVVTPTTPVGVAPVPAPAPPAAAPAVGIVRDGNQAQQIVANSAVASTGSVRAGNPLAAKQIQDTIRDQWNQTENLKHIQDAATLQAIGSAIGEAVQSANDSTSGPTLVRGPLDNLKHFVSGVLTGLDKGVGTVVGNIGGTVNKTIRADFGLQLTRFIGDIFIYQHKRAAIQQRLWDAIHESAPGFGVQGNPISVVAHSLGSVVSFDTAVTGTPQLWIDGFVTFGGQPSYFYVMDTSGDGLPVYKTGQATQLPPSINRWLNIWEPLDVLAFLQGRVFKMASNQSPADVELSHLASAGLWTHSSYWKRPELIDAIRKTV